MKEEVMVSLDELPDVLVIGRERIRIRIARARMQSSNDEVGGRLQTDDEIGRRHIPGKQVVQTLVDEQLVVVEVEVRVDLVFLEQVVADRRLVEEVGLSKRGLLAMPAEQVEQLRLQRRSRTVSVEVGEKGVFRLLQHNAGVKAAGEALSQRRLAHADWPFDRDVAKVQDAAQYSGRSGGRQANRRPPIGTRSRDIIPTLMKIERIELRLVRLPLVHFFETSFGRSYDRSFVLVTVDGGGLRGYGECVAEDNPYYSYETFETVWHIVTEFLAPRTLNVEFAHPRDVFPAWKAVRGHNMAKAGLEMAAWDLFARQQQVPLSALFGGTRTRIASGVSIGIQDSLDQLAGKVETELAAGYRRIKIKIKPGWDVDAVKTVRNRFGDIPLMVDANAAYTLADADHLAGLDEYGLMMIEQPLDYDDLVDHARLQQRLKTPICLDESIKTVRAAREAIAMGACRIINIKPGRVGGHGESIKLHDLCAEQGVPVWHGGMLETGIGRAHNLHLSTLPNFSLPGDVAASKRYYSPDLIEPPIEVSADGTIPVPTAPGIGVTLVPERLERATLRTISLNGHG